MDFSGIYLSEDIIDRFFCNLLYNDMFSFYQINKYTYERYDNYIKYLIYDFLNTNYRYFKIWMKNYIYSEEEIFEMGINATKGVNHVWGSPIYRYYDLRFLFELIYAGLDVYNVKIIEASNDHINLHYDMQIIKSCISFNRFETIQNINKEMLLYSLHIMFKITKTYDYDNIYSIEWDTI